MGWPLEGAFWLSQQGHDMGWSLEDAFGCHSKVSGLHCCTKSTRQDPWQGSTLTLHEVEAAHPKLISTWCYALRVWHGNLKQYASHFKQAGRLPCTVAGAAYGSPETRPHTTAAAAVVSRCSSVGRAPDCRLAHIYRMVTGSIPVIEIFWCYFGIISNMSMFLQHVRGCQH